VSVPMAASTKPAATAAALPPELPPAERDSKGGMFVTEPKAEFVEREPMPNSSMFVFPMTRLPFFLSVSMTVALKGL